MLLSELSFQHAIYRFEDANDLILKFIKLAGVTAITMSVLMLTDTNFTSRLVGQRLSMTILLILGVFVSFVAFTGIIAIAKKKEHFMIFVS